MRPRKDVYSKTQEFLNANNIPYTSMNGSIFIIGENKPLKPNKTLALLSYCSRSLDCPIRKSDEKKSKKVLVTSDGCHLCGILCDIGKIFQVKGPLIAEVRIIGSSHDVKEVISKFQRTRVLTHVIVVCCLSRLIKYLQKGRKTYSNVTVIYTPVVGDRICKLPRL